MLSPKSFINFLKQNEVSFVLDIDSDQENAFDEHDKNYLNQILNQNF